MRALASLRHPFRAHRGSFDLVRWFAVLSAATILVLAVASAWFLSRFLMQNTLARDAEIMMMLINSIVRVEEAEQYFVTSGRDPGPGDMKEFFVHMANMPGTLRANVYALDRSILWSSDASLIGERFPDNDELARAFRGEPVVKSGVVGGDDKSEHVDLRGAGTRFVENYLPIWWRSEEAPRVVGVVEVYRTPKRLFEVIERGRLLIWTAAAGAGLFLYVMLFWIVRRAAHTIALQQRQLLEANTLAALGEMASAVAHGLRNPLAAIRSSAELALEGGPADEAAELMTDIVAQSDRLEGWVRQYLRYARTDHGATDRAHLGSTVARALEQFASEFARRGIDVEVDIDAGLPASAINDLILAQVVNGLLANASEAMTRGGRIEISAAAEGDGVVELCVRDDGPGMSAGQIRAAFEPFRTSKSTGLGLGLPLARDIVRRQGGDLRLESAPGRGTAAILSLPRA